jgi:Xaa-Pro aminopeptidase
MRAAAVSIVCLMLAGVAFADEAQQDLKDRRARAMAKLGTESMLVLFSAPPRVYSADVDYEYRQDSDLYYFTGITQADTMLVLMPGNATNKESCSCASRMPAGNTGTDIR